MEKLSKIKTTTVCCLASIFLFLTVSGCADGLNGNGTIIVAIKYTGINVAQAMVYLNKDSLYIPGHLNAEFDRQERADASGVASFANLMPGKYFVTATGKDGHEFKSVYGVDSVIIRKRYRQNSYDMVLHTHLK